jgi:hypothetical protein
VTSSRFRLFATDETRVAVLHTVPSRILSFALQAGLSRTKIVFRMPITTKGSRRLFFLFAFVQFTKSFYSMSALHLRQFLVF